MRRLAKISTFLTLIIIMMMLFAGCDIDIFPAKQGFYGTLWILTGTMTYHGGDWQFNGTSATAADPYNLAFTHLMGNYQKTTYNNVFGAFLVTLTPPQPGDSDDKNKFYIASAQLRTRDTTQHDQSDQMRTSPNYVAFIHPDQNQNKWAPLTPPPPPDVKKYPIINLCLVSEILQNIGNIYLIAEDSIIYQ